MRRAAEAASGVPRLLRRQAPGRSLHGSLEPGIKELVNLPHLNLYIMV
jgi:hypothetical protein